MCRISAQQSEGSFSSQRRPHETSEVTQEPPGEQEQPSGPRTFKEKFVDKLKSLSIMPSPNQALETFREDTGGALASIPLGWRAPIAGLPLLLSTPTVHAYGANALKSSSVRVSSVAKPDKSVHALHTIPTIRCVYHVSQETFHKI